MKKIRDRIRIGTIFSKTVFGKQFVVTNVWFDCGGSIMVVNYVKCGINWPALLFVHSMSDEQIEEVHIIKGNYIPDTQNRFYLLKRIKWGHENYKISIILYSWILLSISFSNIYKWGQCE